MIAITKSRAADDSSSKFSTKLLPQLLPLQVRVVHPEFAPLERSQVYVDLLPDMTRIDRRHFNTQRDAVAAAQQLSEAQDNAGFAVIRAYNAADPVRFLIAPTLTIGSGGVRYGDNSSREVNRWRGDADPLTRWFAGPAAIAMGLTVGTRDSSYGARLLSVRALVVGNRVADRDTGMVTWDGNDAGRQLGWKAAI